MSYEQQIKEAGLRYKTKFYVDEINVSRELLQYCILTSLSKTDLFEKTAFLGGTSLRLFRGLDRFSEDLDFSLLKPDTSFEFKSYLEKAIIELNNNGINAEFKDKSKSDVNVKKAFIRDSTVPQILEFSWATRKTDTPQKINVKLEVDANPPLGANYETKIIPFPEHEKITLFDMPSAFAGKCHALLTRKYIKGRDWYDFLFYVSQHIEPNYKLLTNALKQTGNYTLSQPLMDFKNLAPILNEKIENLDMAVVKNDLEDFVTNERNHFIEKWDKNLFHSAVKTMSEYCGKNKEKHRDDDYNRGR